MLTSYFDMARAQIELHGGVVEKFIGDAVVGIFGVPVAHGDDPERAVRAALRIAEDATTPARPRWLAACACGSESTRARPSSGSSDSRRGGALHHRRQRQHGFADPVGRTGDGRRRRRGDLGGDPASVRLRGAPAGGAQRQGRAGARVPRRRPRARPSGSTSRAATTGPFVGRTAELRTLTDCLDDAVSTRLAAVRDDRRRTRPRQEPPRRRAARPCRRHPMLVTWRQGRCLPYGSGISFWALGEIVKAPGRHPRLGRRHRSRSPSSTTRCPRARNAPGSASGCCRCSGSSPGRAPSATSSSLPGAASSSSSPGSARRSSSSRTSTGPTTAMLAFLEDSRPTPRVPAARASGRRGPELLDRSRRCRQPGAVRIELQPLPDDAAADLLRTLLDGVALAPRARSSRPRARRAATRCSPRSSSACSATATCSSTTDGATDAPRPARSSRSRSRSSRSSRPASTPCRRPWKAILGDAAVIGKVFWAGAVAAMGERPLDEVTRRSTASPNASSSACSLARRSRTSASTRSGTSSPGTSPTRRMPRARRSSRHVAAARWIDRRQATASRTSPRSSPTTTSRPWISRPRSATRRSPTELRPEALRFLLLAGQRTLGLDIHGRPRAHRAGPRPRAVRPSAPAVALERTATP